MWGPGLAALLTTRYVLRQPVSRLNLGRMGPMRYYAWAWLLPVGLVIVTGLLTLALGQGQLDLSFPAVQRTLAENPASPPISAQMVVGLQIILAVSVAPVINMLLTMGEELGWRGFLLPRLLPLGQQPAILISGLIWGIWHIPVIVQGQNYPGRPVIGCFMMVVFTTLLGAVFSWLYLNTESPWASALAHGSLNASGYLPLLFMPDVDRIIAGTPASLVGWIALVGFVTWLVLSRRLPVEPNGAQV